MVKKMIAIINYGTEDFRLEEVDVPKAGPAEVVAKVLATGICSSDIKCYTGHNPVPVPVIPGHEFVAQVVELGKGAAQKYKLNLGDKVVSEQIVPCHECWFCNTGKYWLCQQANVYGFSRVVAEGAMAEYIRFSSNALNYKVPQELSNRAAAMIEPLSCAIHAVQRAKIEFGDVVVIAGAGALGLCMLQLARLKNPSKVIILDTMENRLNIARNLRADLVINVKQQDPIKLIKELTNGYGCDVYIEASGYPASVTQGLDMVRKQGCFVVFGVYGEPVQADWRMIGDQKELDVYGSSLGPYCYPLAIDYLSRGLVNVNRIATHVFPLSEYKHAFEVAMGKDDSGAIKVLLEP